MKVEPIGTYRARYGTCRLCGWEGNLSRTHVPPRASGNRDISRPAVRLTGDDGLAHLGLGRGTEGGMWGRWFCRRCNIAVGRWDEEYLRWQRPIVLGIHDSPEPPRQRLLSRFGNADPGAFVRCLWAWMFAVDPQLRVSHPALAKAVESGEPVVPPDDLRLVLAVTPQLGMWISSQYAVTMAEMPMAGVGWQQQRSLLWTPANSPQLVDVPLVVVSAPPFVVTLTDRRHRDQLNHFDTGPWLSEAAGHRRPTTLDLAIVAVEQSGDAGVITYNQIVGARVTQ